MAITQQEAIQKLRQDFRVIDDGRAVLVVTGEGRSSRCRRYESTETAAFELVVKPLIEGKRGASK